MLLGTQAYSGVTLTANYAVFDTSVTLSNGVPVTNLSGIAGTQKYFQIVVPAGQSKFEIDLSGGTGDADLYVRLGAKPTLTTYDYKPNVQGNNETVQIDKPTAGTYYIMVRGNQSFSGVTLVATYGGTPRPARSPCCKTAWRSPDLPARPTVRLSSPSACRPARPSWTS